MDHNESAWLAPPQRLRLHRGEVHVWLVLLDGSNTSGTNLLSVAERQRAERLAQPRARGQYIASQRMLRMILARYLDVSPSAIQFLRSPAGKPYLDPRHGSTLRFNLSHSGSWALFAFAVGQEVGVDLETHRPVDPLALAQRFFCAAEARRLRTLPIAQRPRSFFELWTAKEALAKAMGTGIAGTLNRFDVDVSGAQPRWIDLQDRGRSAQWSLHHLPAPTGCSASLAVEGELHGLRHFRGH